MSTAKKAAMIFIGILSGMHLAAGVIVQIKLVFNLEVNSVLPIKAEMTVTQILLLNFIAVTAVMLLISVVLTYLVTDIPYSPIEIIKNCPQIALIPVALLAIAGTVNTFCAKSTADGLYIFAATVLFVLFGVIHFGALITIKEDV